jgi:peptidase M23-like protein
VRCQSYCRSFILGLVVAIVAGPGWCQDKLSIPEFFGLYAMDGGHSVPLHEGDGTITANRNIQVYSIPQNALWSNTVAEVSPGTRFVLFYADAGEMIHSMTLHRLPLVRNVLATPEPPYRGEPRLVSTANQPLLARIQELSFRILSKPVPNQSQMIELVPSPHLSPGLYVIDYEPQGKAGWFALFAVSSSSDAEKRYCLDLILPGGYAGAFERANSELSNAAPLLINRRYRSCETVGANTTSIPSTGSAASATARNDNSTPLHLSTTCSSYDGCMSAGNKALGAANWTEAVGDFQAATSLKPGSGDAWYSLGDAYLDAGRTNDFASAWDKAVNLGRPLAILLCHERRFQSCEQGSLVLKSDAISFAASGRPLFSGAPAAVEVKGTGSDSVSSASVTLSWTYVTLRVASKNYTFYPVVAGVQCQMLEQLGHPACPPEGATRQLAIANYVAQTIPKLASGHLGGPAPGAPSSVPDAPRQATPSTPPQERTGTAACPVPFNNNVIPKACIGEFSHGTLVFEDANKNLSLPTPAHAGNLTHPGMDLVAPCDVSAIHPIADGTVETVVNSSLDPNWGEPGKRGLGYLVLVRHSASIADKATYSIYLHMNKPPLVKTGDSVVAGKTVLGFVGQTGAAWGCHTHLEIRHFSTLLLNDTRWHDPPNIYGYR